MAKDKNPYPVTLEKGVTAIPTRFGGLKICVLEDAFEQEKSGSYVIRKIVEAHYIALGRFAPTDIVMPEWVTNQKEYVLQMKEKGHRIKSRFPGVHLHHRENNFIQWRVEIRKGTGENKKLLLSKHFPLTPEGELQAHKAKVDFLQNTNTTANIKGLSAEY